MSFPAGDFQIALIPYAANGVQCEHRFEWYLDDPLVATGKLPELKSAPTSSWLLARLRALDESIPAEASEHNDGGGYCFEMAVAEGDSLVATFQLQADTEGAVALGSATDAQTAGHVLEQFVDTLAQDPDDVAECCYSINRSGMDDGPRTALSPRPLRILKTNTAGATDCISARTTFARDSEPAIRPTSRLVGWSLDRPQHEPLDAGILSKLDHLLHKAGARLRIGCNDHGDALGVMPLFRDVVEQLFEFSR